MTGFPDTQRVAPVAPGDSGQGSVGRSGNPARDGLEQLHGGWPFSDGPDAWPWFTQQRGETEIQPAGIHVCCGECLQSVSRVNNWRITWQTLKPQLAAHVMQVHLDLIGC